MSTFLDHAATTPVRPLALDAYLEALAHLGNPSSVHAHGRETRELLEQARELLAKSADCNLAEVVFTSGGSEANNLAIKGFFWQRQEQRPRKYVISALTEHHAVIDPIEWLEKHEGAQLLWLPVDKTGQPDLETYRGWLSQYGDEIALVSLMWVNNETGAIWDIPAMAALAKEYGIPVHSDAVAAFGHTEISFKDSNLAAMSVSGHKLGAPIGVGALIVSRSQKPISLIHGGGQERGLRSGTMNYPHAFSLAMASKLAVTDMTAREARLEGLRNQLEEKVLSQVRQAQKTISGPRIGHTASFIFPGVQSDSLIFLLDQKGISVSAGSACQAGVLSASHVLLAMGYSEAEASGVLRVTLGHTTTDEDIDVFTSSILEVYQTALRAGLNR
jgi:cysteine desulfurase